MCRSHSTRRRPYCWRRCGCACRLADRCSRRSHFPALASPRDPCARADILASAPHQQDGSRNEQPGLASKCARLRTSRKKIAAGAMPSVRAKLSPMISTPACRIRKPAHSGNNEQGEAVICRLFTARSVKEGPLRSCSNHVLIRSRSRNPRRKFRNRQHNREDSVHVGVLR